MIALDFMHCKYLGHDQYTYGSIFKLLVRRVLPDEPLKNLRVIWSEIQKYYKEHKVTSRYRSITKLTMFERKGQSFPKMRGKASEIRHLAGPLLAVWEAHMNESLDIHRRIRLYLKLNYSLEELLSVHRTELALPPEDAQVFESTLDKMLLLLTNIAEHFLGARLFNLTQKSHFLQHVASLSACISPRLLWCFQGEDMQRRMATLAKQCVRGQGPGQSSIKMFQRYRLALHLNFEAQE